MELYLRDVSEDDILVFFEHLQDPVAVHMAAFTATDSWSLKAHTAHWQKLLANDMIIKRSIVVDEDLVGHIASWVQDGEREITYWIDRDHWGKGVATEALKTFLGEVKVRPLFARTAADNDASVHVLLKCGFTLVGAGRGFANARDREIDELVYRIDADAN
jgi:RimJ/RimL family protein N-acetyltransferase